MTELTHALNMAVILEYRRAIENTIYYLSIL